MGVVANKLQKIGQRTFRRQRVIIEDGLKCIHARNFGQIIQSSVQYRYCSGKSAHEGSYNKKWGDSHYLLCLMTCSESSEVGKKRILLYQT